MISNLTPTVKILLIINVIAFFLMGIDREYAIIHFALWDYRSALFQPFQLLTHMFMHANMFHLFGNMLGILFFGSILEQLLGQNRFLSLYLVCGFGAGVCTLLLNYYANSQETVSLGASGAVFGVVTSFALVFPNMPLQLLFPPISLKAKYMVLLYLVFELSFGLQNRQGDNIGHFAHLAGMLFAFIMIKLVWRIPKKY